MIVRIRLSPGGRVGRGVRKNRRLALAAGALLVPAAFLAIVLGTWRLAADLNWTAEFAIHEGPLSHWQVWMAFAALLLLCSRRLNRYGHGGGEAA